MSTPQSSGSITERTYSAITILLKQAPAELQDQHSELLQDMLNIAHSTELSELEITAWSVYLFRSGWKWYSSDAHTLLYTAHAAKAFLNDPSVFPQVSQELRLGYERWLHEHGQELLISFHDLNECFRELFVRQLQLIAREEVNYDALVTELLELSFRARS